MKLLSLTRRSQPNPATQNNSLVTAQDEFNRMFDDLFTNFGLTPVTGGRLSLLNSFTPKVNIAETEKEFSVTAELPGMDEKDVAVEFTDNTLIIKGEKKEDHEEKNKQWHVIEHSYGSFHREIHVNAQVDAEKVTANFKKGILKITLPKLPEEKSSRKKIEIKAE